MASIIQDPGLIVYDRLFFELSGGNYDVYISQDSPIFIEEYFIIRPIFKDLFVANPDNLCDFKHKNRSTTLNSKNKMKNWGERLSIHFIIYSESKKRELVGLGIKIATKSKINLESFSITPKGRVQKIMFLITRALLESTFHKIKYQNIVINL